MRNLLFLLALFILPNMNAQLSSIIKVDFDMNGRPETEVHESGYYAWPVVECKVETKIIEGIEFTIANGANSSGSSLKSHWYKAGIQAPNYARLVCDGLTVKDGERGGEIRLTIKGLEPGKHTLLTYHNTLDSPDDKTFSDINIYVNGELIVENLSPTNRALSTYDAQSAYISFEAKKDTPVDFLFAPDYNSKASSLNVIINGFSLDEPNIVRQAKSPLPANMDYHTNADDGSCILSWVAAENAVAHEIYFGTDLDLVTNADKNSVSCYKGSQSITEFPVTNLYSMNTYYWRVDEVEADGTITKGEVWSFMPRHLAFPEAEGYGRFARGGRGGKVIYVTNLNDNGPGSLREAITNNVGARTILFAVSGIISLEDRLTLAHSNITIAGQTSPGKGICVKGAPFGFSGVTDGIMRFIRVRVGSGRTFDASGMNGAEHCIFDHNSFSWAIDEVFSSRSGKNFTLQKTMLAEALNVAGHKNYPAGKEHGFAASIGGDIGSFHHNLLAHCYGRNWSLAGGLDGTGAYAGRLDIFNNVVYNWGGRATDGGAYEVNFVNNYYKKGAGTKQLYLLNAQLEGAGTGSQSYFYSGNVMTEPNGEVVYDGTNNKEGRTYTLSGGQVLNWDVWVNEPFFESHAKIESASDAYKSVLSDVGCTLPIFDDHDVRVITETLDGTYSCVGSKSGKPGFPDSQEDVGGYEDYPEITINLDEFDTDRDGLPNWWEEMFGLNPNSPEGDFSDSNADDNMDGYTNLEEYLHWMATPHYEVNPGETVEVDLAQYTRGFEKNPVYTVAKMDNATAPIEGSVMKVTPESSFGGIIYVDFTVTDAEGSSLTRSIGVKDGNHSSGVDSVLEEKQYAVNVYPNPVADYLYISSRIAGDAGIQLMNAYGNQVLTNVLNISGNVACKLDVSSLPMGVYFLKIQLGDSCKTVKFIKK